MSSTIRILLESVSIFVACLLLIWLLTLTNNATETNNAALTGSDLTTYKVTQDNDFIDYLKTSECITKNCTNYNNCISPNHVKVIYYRKEILGDEVLRLINKYNEIVDGTVLVRTDKITRNYNKLYKFIKNMPNNLDYINPKETFVAKIILKDNKPYTMYFSQKGTMFNIIGEESSEKAIEELMFHSIGHTSSNFLMFTESSTYNFPDNTNINKIKVYACASGKGTKAGEALAGEVIKASDYGLPNFSSCEIVVNLTYEGDTSINLFRPNKSIAIYKKNLQAGNYVELNDQNAEEAKYLFGSYKTGEDGENGSDGYRYIVSYSEGKTNVKATELVYKGGIGGEGGIYGFGGAGGNAGYIVKHERGIASFKGYSANGGGSGVIGYKSNDKEISTKLLSLSIVGYGGIVNNAPYPFLLINDEGEIQKSIYYNHNYTQVESRLNGGSGTLYYGGYGGAASSISFSDVNVDISTTDWWVMFNGAGGGGGGYGAGGGEAGECSYNYNREQEYGHPSGGMVYLEFYKEEEGS